MIGIIDSGSGGLSVLVEVRKVFPCADILYFGDIKNAPYGEKSHAELSRLTIDALKFLKENNVTDVISACNSVSASMAISLFDTLLPAQHIVEMVGPTVHEFKDDSRRIALCATQATVDSGMYQNAFRMLGKENILSIPIPALAGQIEFGADAKQVMKTIAEAIQPHLEQFDVLILGCTHYPLVIDIFKAVIGEHATVINPAEAVARKAKQVFKATESGSGKTRFVISADSDPFRTYVEKRFADSPHTIEVLP